MSDAPVIIHVVDDDAAFRAAISRGNLRRWYYRH
jgi:hypothetical protein